MTVMFSYPDRQCQLGHGMRVESGRPVESPEPVEVNIEVIGRYAFEAVQPATQSRDERDGVPDVPDTIDMHASGDVNRMTAHAKMTSSGSRRAAVVSKEHFVIRQDPPERRANVTTGSQNGPGSAMLELSQQMWPMT